MTRPHTQGVSVNQKSWTEVAFVVLAFALVLGLVRLAAFDRQPPEATTTEPPLTINRP